MSSQLSPADLHISDQELGTGGAGAVYKGVLRTGPTSRPVAVKVLEPSSSGSEKLQHAPRELQLLCKALEKCPYVCQPLGYCIKDGKQCMVLALYPKSLKDVIRETPGPGLDLKTAVQMGKQIAEALRRLHNDARMAHFDIKPDNILVGHDGTCFLSDFSIAREFPPHTTHIRLPQDAYGSMNYMAPEQVTGSATQGVTFRADVWGLGCTLLEACTGEMPFAACKNTAEIVEQLMQGKSPAVPAQLDPRFAAILKRSLAPNAAQRPDATQLRHELSQLNELLSIEAGGRTHVPPAVLQSAELSARPSGAAAPSPPPEVDLLSSGPMDIPPVAAGALQRPHPGPPLPTSTSMSTAPMSGHAPPTGQHQEVEPLLITATLGGELGVKCLFRKYYSLLPNRYDTKQMTGVCFVPAASGPLGPVTEAVSVSAAGILTWWDFVKGAAGGRIAGMGSLVAGGLPEGAKGRSVAVGRRFVVVGTDRSRLAVWQFHNGGASWVENASMNTQPELQQPRCVSRVEMSNPSDPLQKIYDLALQPAYMEDRGANWLASVSDQGHFALWDTTTWKGIFSTKATTSQIFSCCAMPGSNMVAIATTAPRIVQVWDCRQASAAAEMGAATKAIQQVMSCELQRSGVPGEDEESVLCVSAVPNTSGVFPSQLLLGSRNGRLYVWDLRQPRYLLTVAQFSDRVCGCVASPCGRRVMAAARSGMVGMLDWTQPPTGTQQIPPLPQDPCVAQYHHYHRMYHWPALEHGILRLAAGNVVAATQRAPTV